MHTTSRNAVVVNFKANYGLFDRRGSQDGDTDCCLPSIGHYYRQKYWADTNTTQYLQVMANTHYPNTGIVRTLIYTEWHYCCLSHPVTSPNQADVLFISAGELVDISLHSAVCYLLPQHAPVWPVQHRCSVNPWPHLQNAFDIIHQILDERCAWWVSSAVVT